MRAERQPRAPIIQIQRAQFCAAGEAESAGRLALSVERLRDAYFEPVAATELLRSTQSDPAALCPGRDYSALAALADALLENAPFEHYALTKAKLLATKGLVAAQEDQSSRAITLLTESFRLEPDLDIALFAGSIMFDTERQEELRAFLSEVRQAAPTSPFKRSRWLNRLDKFMQLVGETEPKEAPPKGLQ